MFSLKRGFTIVEIIVVIGILAVLTTVGFTSYTASMRNSRDAKRKTDLETMRQALEMYKSDNGSYPVVPEPPYYYSSEANDAAPNNGGFWIPGLSPNYLMVLPHDPQGGYSTNPACTPGSWKRAYLYRSNGTNYKLLAHCLEGNWTSSDPYYDPVRYNLVTGIGWAWQVSSNETARTTW